MWGVVSSSDPDSSAISSESGSLSPAAADMMVRLAVAVRGTFAEMRGEQWPHRGSVCSKRLQDRIQRDFPEEYDAIVNSIYGRSWKRYLAARAGILSFEEDYGASQPDTEWLLATGVLRCYLRTEDIQRVREADVILGRLVRDKCRGDLENSCRTIIMEEFAALLFRRFMGDESANDSACHMAEEMTGEASDETDDKNFSVGDYSLGSLALWQSILCRLWLRPAEGRRVRLRDLRRPCQQLGFHIRLRCRWTELLGNNLLQRYIRSCVLRVLLNAVAPPLEPATGSPPDEMNGALVLRFDVLLGEYILILEESRMWGRIPPIIGHFLRQE
ncbi:hypothetical protein TraAM80_03738 [Trypanosoma rangeli]|uniref:Uncharacterized protein n=1 Tax=Trypanosoma rangeli TaxID=5698 RepID=A0A422NN48_TRYRA|nr:uncharacterized protein TraAM80_03738 [Trypanosoma rangeli]RNF06922.1 hypothetical protein TraAM80_03738 [Trypanosoma rangeli]|eukprot:RNF06922.1 hypothetical protein TraAM80_03738 [Trypanosoma rangeli]